MRVWRICRQPYATDPLSGRGGLFASGRWHTKGRRVTYTSGSRALAALEVLVHVDRDTLPSDLVQIEIDIPDTLKMARIDVKSLPKRWLSFPSPSVLQQLGDDWLTAESTAVLQVPSVVIPEESNYILNPQHADARKITPLKTTAFRYDVRLGS